MGSSTERKQVRAFLSSTFSDFMEERDLLAKQVFPSLRQKARERGVEVVEVDLRWGITQEQSDRGETLSICLAEIDRCRPYFICLLGDRYGWIPPTDRYPPELIERQPWLKDHQGGTSVTELEILHGVLNDPGMAGRAFFYFRDSAYSDSKQGAGWQSTTEAERDKLQALKQRILASGFPVVEDLEDPQVIAQRIETDLWQLIDQQFAEAEKPSVLEVEAASHASYRADRTGVYLGGESYITELEEWIRQGEQRIQVSGESGSGKSALIANWCSDHEKSHPEDIVYCHHMGCSNDANSEKLLMRRLIDTAAVLLEDELDVPQDYWELVAKVGETLARLSFWAKAKGCCWIWALDGLDKLEDQEALPWLPDTLPEQIHIIASTLDSQVKSILDERNYKELTIAPLQRKEKEALIDKYLKVFARQLEGDLKETILAHPLSGSPIFLRTLLEEMRQCGKFKELNEQLTFYLSSKTIDDLFERVLERLESDADRDSVQKTMTALWASRAGLSESELLEITGLKPFEWAPINISLQESLSETSNRLVFTHDYMRIAIKDRYLPTDELKREAHSDLADWWEQKDAWDSRKAEEYPWQLERAERKDDLRGLLLGSSNLASLNSECGSREVIDYWRRCHKPDDPELDILISEDIINEIELRKKSSEDLGWFIDQLGALLDEAGYYRELLLNIRKITLAFEEQKNSSNNKILLTKQFVLANTYMSAGEYQEAEKLLEICFNGRKQSLGKDHIDTLAVENNLGLIYYYNHKYNKAEEKYINILNCYKAQRRNDWRYLTTLNNLALVLTSKEEFNKAEVIYKECLTEQKRQFGGKYPNTTYVHNLASLYYRVGKHKKAEQLILSCLSLSKKLLGENHPKNLKLLSTLGLVYIEEEEYLKAKNILEDTLKMQTKTLGIQHPDNFYTQNHIADCYSSMKEFDKSISLRKSLYDWFRDNRGVNNLTTLNVFHNLADDLQEIGNYQEALTIYKEVINYRSEQLGRDHLRTMQSIFSMADCLSNLDCHEEAISLRKEELSWSRYKYGNNDPSTQDSIEYLATELLINGELEEAEALFRELLVLRQESLEPDDFDIGDALGGLAETLEKGGQLKEALIYAQQCFDHRLQYEGKESFYTNRNRLELARVLNKLERKREAMNLINEIQASFEKIEELDENDQDLLSKVSELRDLINQSEA